MVIIFVFSMMQGDDSSQTSGIILKSVAGTLENVINGELGETFLGWLHVFIRKTAHFTEYGMLGISLGYGLWYFWRTKRFPYVLPMVIAFFYACSDEIHQYFVPGRSSKIIDVIIDTAGAFCGLVIYTRLYNKKYKDGGEY